MGTYTDGGRATGTGCSTGLGGSPTLRESAGRRDHGRAGAAGWEILRRRSLYRPIGPGAALHSLGSKRRELVERVQCGRVASGSENADPPVTVGCGNGGGSPSTGCRRA